ncbi:hypothetical protein OM076_43180 [Solirubrobacter ginsenosidimutans]|uniref:Uncharacterized protein n=1 Tax=Solirubrobacter ginsenosidimutans TaxID=490573 RepID=A0A9X3SBN1_9ACTN|nr:hypothetical protein [Solirubrobacter ginsenosidimutans]MDA0167143.1 hypothetical protein [Solirubrobacter ginsenosidimutans]
MRAAFAVGWAEGHPFEVWALYTSRREAQRHAAAAAYVFQVFALPVYEDYGEVPRWLRPPWRFGTRFRERVADEVELTADALMEGELEAVEAGPVVAVIDFDPPEPQEVRLLFTHTSAAAPYLQDRADWAEPQRSDTMPVYGSYEACPPGQRYTAPGPPLSQLVLPR